MRKKFIEKKFAWWGISAAMAAGMIITSTSSAYSISATYILNRLVKNHEHLRTLEMEGKISDLKNQVSFHENMHIDFTSGKIHSVFMNEAGDVLAEKNSKLMESHPLGMAWLGLSADGYVSQVQTILGQLGITAKDDAKVNLTRIQTRPVFEIGDASVVKIEKDDFLFAAYQNDAKDGVEVETYSTSGSVKLPKTIAFKKGDTILYHYELTSFKANSPYKNSAKVAPGRAVSPAIQGWNDLVH